MLIVGGMNLTSSSSSAVLRALPLLAPAERCSGSLLRKLAARTVRIRACCRDAWPLAADILELRSLARMNPFEGFLVAAYVAIVAQPLVYGSLGNSMVALMTPVR